LFPGFYNFAIVVAAAAAVDIVVAIDI